MDFTDLGISNVLELCLNSQGIEIPTDIQEKVIPEVLARKDVVAKSETGSGKTLAYLLPIYMMVNPKERNTQAIILTPTHELAVQVHKQAQELSNWEGVEVRSALVIGGASILRQLDKLKEKPQIVIGSAGRILDIIKKKKIQAHTCKIIVIDEADRMLDDLNIKDVKAVIKTTLISERQILLFSASIDDKTKKVAEEIMKDPVLIEKEKGILPKEIEHYYITADERDKLTILRKLVAGLKPEKTIIFINNPNNIEVMVEKLAYHGLKVGGIYGAAFKDQRKNVMNAFREGRINILVASDIGARGLDFCGVELVINLDISEEPVYYQHRAGRTGRNGEHGKVVSVVTVNEKRWLRRYENEFGIDIKERTMSYGELCEPKENKKIVKKSKKKKK